VTRDYLILDEPTAVLPRGEEPAICDPAQAPGNWPLGRDRYAQAQRIMECADRVTVMRDGQVLATRTIGSTSEAGVDRLMVGREVNLRVDKSNQKLASRFCN